MTNLTEKQIQAAHHFTGPAIVTAGPGSGKTMVLIDRIRFLIEEKRVPPEQILAVTFTEKATAEMSARLFKAVGTKAEAVHVSTIHSLCRTIMEDWFMFHEFGASFGILDGETQKLFVNANRYKLGLNGEHGWLGLIGRAGGHEHRNEEQVCALYNTITEHAIDPADLYKEIKSLGLYADDGRALLESYATYGALLREDKLVDFAHLQSVALAVLSGQNEALAGVRERFAFALIDEYQDTSPIQDRLIALIVGGYKNIFVVGDENQSIYGFRGADVENFSKFPERYPGAKSYSLMTNFRSGKTIVDTANLLLESRIREKLQAHRNKGNEIILITGENRLETARNTVAFLKKKISEGRLSIGDAAFLYRKKSLVKEIAAALAEAGLPFVSDSDDGFLERPEIRDTIKLFSYIHQDAADETGFKGWSDWWRLDVFDNEIVSFSKKTVALLHGLPRDCVLSDVTSEENAAALGVTVQKDARAIVALNQLKAQVGEGKIGLLESLYEIFKTGGCLSRWLKEAGPENEAKLSNVAQLTSLVAKYEAQFARPSAKNLLWFLHNRTMASESAGAAADAGEAAKCLTVHKAKGLEFPAVVVCSLLDGDFPLAFREHESVCGIPIPKGLLHTTGADETKHDDEELRLFYVAITRAQDLLILAVPERKNVNKAKPSPFLGLIEKYVTGRVDSAVVMEKKYEAPKTTPSLSYSAAHTYSECPFLYRLTYEYRFAAPPDANQKHGVITHGVLQKVNWAIQRGLPVGEAEVKKIIEKSWVTIRGKKADEKTKQNYLANTLKYVAFTKINFKSIESFEKPFTYIDDHMIVRGKTDLLAKDKDGRGLLIDFKARSMEGIEETGVEDQLRIYHRCLKHANIERLGTYTFFDAGFRDFERDDEAAGRILERVSAGLAAGEYPRRVREKVCEKCFFKFICDGLRV